MALFPKVESPCPYKGDLSAIMEGDVCRSCHRQVFDLTHMSDGERTAFLKGCSGQVCVSYRMPTLVAVALAAAVTSAAASDQEIVIITGGIHDPQNAQYIQVPDAKPAPRLPVVTEPKPAVGSSASSPVNSKISSKAPS